MPRQKKAQKLRLHRVNEHFKSFFNAALASAVVMLRSQDKEKGRIYGLYEPILTEKLMKAVKMCDESV